MALLVQGPKGTQDLLPEQTARWQVVEQVMREEASLYGYGEIRTPVFEHTELFQRSVGETTDVVQKEMYTFNDKGGRSITLRPEGTAGAVRALLEHALYNEGLPVKLFYFTSCYRYEKPQAGRLREFHQFGVEAFGSADPIADAETILLGKSIFDRLGMKGYSIEINSIGCPECRAKYHQALKEYFTASIDQLCDTCKDRLDRNPMRILDCKNPPCGAVAKNAPIMLDYLCDDCRDHFDGVKGYLDDAGVDYKINPTIVRGLDYYTRTVFEFVSSDLGAQSTFCGGGRYDGLVAEMGGKPLPALGYAIGLERVLMILQAQGIELPVQPQCELFIAAIGEASQKSAFALVRRMRECSVFAQFDSCGRSLKAQMKYADKIGAAYTLVLGNDELQSGRGKLKNMKTGELIEISLKEETFASEYLAATVAAGTAGANPSI
ncbi:MAG: histidine--tRNA ligase [Clostridium sp.]|uniref:histidine--tRNA ligase n=1 Tax=Clostridium sp. TaxID=1506 RepID=UPI002907BD1D|nr:histidine--tRNA ligase [Clostridium sp.]MDU7338993.1 histidine--tRNA ligase [Clostridium sp.]